MRARRRTIERMVSGMTTIKTGIRWATVAMVLATTLFVIVRHMDRSLWNDEVWIVDAAGQPTYSQALSAAKDARVTVSPGYLAVSRVCAAWAQGRPWVFRIPPAIFGVGLLICMAMVLGGLAGNRSLGFGAVLIFLASPLIQRYLTEAKQYMTAAMFTVVLIAVADGWVRSRRFVAGVAWLIVALVAVVMSFATWFAVAGTGLVVWASWLVRKDRTRLVQATGYGVLVASLGAAVYLGFVRPIASRVTQEFATYWGDAYLPLDGSWLAQAWRIGNEMLQQAWYLYTVPTWAMLLLAGLGGYVWYRRQPIAALGALATVGVTVLASTLHVWPLGARINISLLAILHLAMLAGPLGLWGSMVNKQSNRAKSNETSLERFSFRLQRIPITSRDRQGAGLLSTVATLNKNAPDQKAGDRGDDKPILVDLAALLLTIVVAIGVAVKSSGADYEVAAVDQLLDEVADRATPRDLVLLDWTASVNQRLLPRSIEGTIGAASWPDIDKVVDETQRSIDGWSGRYVYIAAGHHNAELAAGWEVLGEALSRYGRFEKVWTGKLAALYRFEPEG